MTIIVDILIELTKQHDIYCHIEYNVDRSLLMLDLNTKAKGHLYLFSDGLLVGRYGQRKLIDLERSMEDILVDLCGQYVISKCGKNYGNSGWEILCSKMGISSDTLPF